MEFVAGLALFFIPTSWFTAAAAALTQHELSEDPRDFVASHLLAWAQTISPSATGYYAIYLSLHGVVKLALVAALFKRWLWAYPASLVVFAGFVAYQVDQFSFHHSWGLVALTVLDVVVMWLIWQEYADLSAKASVKQRGH